jgi:signal transduction histidine kinase
MKFGYMATILVIALLACYLTGVILLTQTAQVSSPPRDAPPLAAPLRAAPPHDAPLPGRHAEQRMDTSAERVPPFPTEGYGLRLMQYRLGDSPVDANGVFDWTKPEAIKDWNRMPMPSDRETGIEYAWFSTMVPSGPMGRIESDAYLLFKNASYEFEVYSGTDLLFRYGDLENGEVSLLPAKPVFLSLKGHTPEKPLFVRIYSKRDSVTAGKIGPVLYGSQTDLKLDLIKADILNGLSLFVFFIIGLVSLLVYFINRDIPANLYFALFSMAVCCNLLFSLKSLVLFLDASMFKMYTEDPLHGAMVYLFILYFVHVLKPVFEVPIRLTGLIIFAAGLLLPVAKLLTPATFEKYSEGIADTANIGFLFLCALCLTIIALSLRSQSSSDAKWFIAGFSLYLTVNIIGYPLRLFIESNPERIKLTPLEFIQVLNASLDYSLLFSTVFLGIISFKRYAEVYRATRDYNRQLSSWNQTLDWKVKERTREIQNLLDHAGQGFLTFNKLLVVQEKYSIECRRLFQKEIADLRYVELLYPHELAEQVLHEEILGSVFQEDDLQRDVCLSLLPAEADVLGKRVALQYKWIPGLEASSGDVMVIITDISERRQLESQMVKERRVLYTVVWVIKYYRDFKEMVAEYRTFALKEMNEFMCRELPAGDKWAELSRIIHTFKGNFAQIDFVHTTEGLHELETQLAGWKEHAADDMSEPTVSSLLMAWLGKFDLLGWLEKDLRILRDILGERFDVGQEIVAIELDRLRHLEQQVYMILPSPEAVVIVKELKKLQHRPLKELLGMYSEYTAKLAERTGKEIYPVRMIGGEMLVNPDVVAAFVRTLIHVFRNMIDHGIETPEERASIGKERRGTIVCEMSGNEQRIKVRLSNNGKEMNLMEIRKNALDKGVCTETEIDTMSADEQRMLIFREGFTTKDRISELSGRGIGLSAVRKALEDLNGTVRVESSAEQDTSFTFEIPLLD